MEQHELIFFIIEIIGILQGLILSMALFFKVKKNHANLYLALCLVSLSFGIILHFTDYIPGINFSNHGIMISIFSVMLGPLLILYVNSLIYPFKKFKLHYLLHFVPFVLLFSLCLIFFILNNKLILEAFNIITQILSYIITFIYLVIIITALIKYSIKLKESYSTLDKINIFWLWILVIGFLFFLISGLVIDMLYITALISIRFDFLWIIVTVFIILLGYITLIKPEILIQLPIDDFITGYKGIKVRYKKSSLTDEMSKEYYNKLILIMKKEKPYIQSNITLPVLAKIVKISTHHLSQVINQEAKTNFFDFINKYRIEEAKKLLSNNHNGNIKIAEIGFEVGYNSLSSFNKAFKKYTSITPSVFRNAQSIRL